MNILQLLKTCHDLEQRGFDGMHPTGEQNITARLAERDGLLERVAVGATDCSALVLIYRLTDLGMRALQDDNPTRSS